MKTTAVLIGMLWLVAGVLRVEAQITDVFSFLNLNKPIPDGNSSGLSEVRTVTSAITNLSSVRLKLRVAGEFNGDLYGYVRHIRNGVTNWCVLLNRVGRTASNSAGYADAGLEVVFDAAATRGEIHTYGAVTNLPAGMPLTGTWQPDGRAVDPGVVLDSTARTTTLSSFTNAAAGGEWTLYLADLASGGTNLLVSWELELSGMATPLVTWQRQYFTQAELANPALEDTYWGDLADPDGDGRNNVLEYALGRSPLDRNDGNQGILAQVRDDGNGHFQYLTFLRRKNDVNLAYEPQVSGDRQTWQTGAGVVLETTVQNVDVDFDRVTYKDLTLVAQGLPRFFQLKVIRNGMAVGTSDIYVATAATVKGNGGSGSYVTRFSVSMVQPWVACGTITALGANTLSDANAIWSEDQFNGVNGAYYLEFASGLTADIVDTQAATPTLVVPGDLRAVLAVGEVYRIRKLATLVDVFGAHNEAGLLGGNNASGADNVVLYDAVSQTSRIYFYSNVPGYTGWYRGDFRLATNVTIYPEQGIAVSRKTAADATVYMSGVVKTGATLVPIEPGFNLVGTVKTVKNLKLSELNLVTGNPVTGLAGGKNPSAADNVALPNQNGWALYFYCNIAGYEGWYDGAFHPAGTVEIPAGSAFSIKRKAPHGAFDWVIPAE